MKKLQDAIESVKYGAVLTINKDKYKINTYNSCIVLYDGRIFKDVKAVELGDFIKIIPNIANQLNLGYTYQVKYLFEEQKYQSNIVHCIRKGGYKELDYYETIHNFEVFNGSFLDSIIELDTKIANGIDKNLDKTKRKVS